MESGLKWVSILLFFIAGLAAIGGVGYTGWKIRDLQIAVEVGNKNSTLLDELQSNLSTLMEASRVAATTALRSQQQALANSQELTNALSAAGLDNCVVPDEQQRMLSDQDKRYNEATGRKPEE